MAAATHALKARYERLSDLQADLRAAGLDSINLIVAIDATKSNVWTGKGESVRR